MLGSVARGTSPLGKTKGQVYEAKRAAFKGGKKGGGKAKGKGKKGKGKINSWETEESSWEDAEWPEESAAPAGEVANKEDGEAYALDVGLGGGFEDEEFPLLGMTVEMPDYYKNEFESRDVPNWRFEFSEKLIMFLYCRFTFYLFSAFLMTVIIGV